MLTGLLEARRDAKQFVPYRWWLRDDADNSRLAFGERAGFVDHQGVDFFHGLEGLGVFD